MKGQSTMPTLYTIGHSTHSWQEFSDILRAQKITHIIDVRTIPKSRRVPWANKDKLKPSLAKHHIHYVHLPALGGLRHAAKDSINQAWHNASFRGYADYMQTPEFFAGLKELNHFLKRRHRVAVMCAEALPWRCHRSLIADAEVVRGIKVLHIMSKTNLKPHELTNFAKVDRNKRPIKIYYPKAKSRSSATG